MRDLFKKKPTNRMKTKDVKMYRICKNLHRNLRIMKVLFKKEPINQSALNGTLSDVGGYGKLECVGWIRRKIILQRRFLTYQTKRLKKKKLKLMSRLVELNESETITEPVQTPAKGQRHYWNDFTYHVMMAITLSKFFNNVLYVLYKKFKFYLFLFLLIQ